MYNDNIHLPTKHGALTVKHYVNLHELAFAEIVNAGHAGLRAARYQGPFIIAPIPSSYSRCPLPYRDSTSTISPVYHTTDTANTANTAKVLWIH